MFSLMQLYIEHNLSGLTSSFQLFLENKIRENILAINSIRIHSFFHITSCTGLGMYSLMQLYRTSFELWLRSTMLV